MRPELIGTFEATGDGGRQVTLRLLLAFHRDPAAVAAGREAWVPDPHPAVLTEDGRRVDRMTGDPERYVVVGTAEVLTPAGATADLYAQYEARRTAAVRGRGV